MRRHANATPSASAGRTRGASTATARLAGGFAVVPFLLAMLLFGAPSAQAAKGVAGFFGNPDSSTSSEAGGRFGTPNGIAVNVSGAGGADPGDIYVADNGKHRIQQFDSNGDFIRAWGRDVIIGGRPNNAGTNEVQRITVNATAGTFTLTFGGQTTSPIAFNASASTVQGAINSLSSLTTPGSSVSVTGGPGGAGGATPYFVTFDGGRFQGADPAQMTAASQLTGTVAVATTTPGVPAVEICDTTAPVPNVPGDCKNGISGGSGFGGELNNPTGIAIDQSNGHVFVTETSRNRVQEFDATGHFVRAWGRDVVITGAPNNISTTAVEVCDVTAGNTPAQCKSGTTGTLGGELASPSAIAVIPAGAPNASNVVVSDPNNRRIHEFDPDAPDGPDAGSSPDVFVRTFGWDVITSGQPGNLAANEQQTLKVSAAGGTFSLTFGANTTVPLPYDSPASGGVGPGASVQNALESIASVGVGNVSVTGGPGDPTGSAPYTIEFKGTKADQDVAELQANGNDLHASAGDELSCFYALATDQNLRPDQPIAFQWLRNSVPIAGATSETYETSAADVGAAIQCQATARKTTGYVFSEVGGPRHNTVNPDANVESAAVQASPPRIVSPAPATPPPVPPAALPKIIRIADPGESTTMTVGSVGGHDLVCSPGTWSGSPTSFSYRWYRNGVPLAGIGNPTSSTYTVQKVDLSSPAFFQCAVTATNPGGSVTLISQPRNGSDFSDYEAVATYPPPCYQYVTFGADGRCDSFGGVAYLPANSAIRSQAIVETVSPGARFEVCTTVGACKASPAGTAAGQFGTNTIRSLTADTTGAVYAVDSGNSRVLKFTPQGGPPALTPSIFGAPGMPNGSAANNGPLAVMLDDEGDLLVARAFPAGATANCLDGSSSQDGELRLQEISSDGATLKETHAVCSGLRGSATNGLGMNPAAGDIFVTSSPIGAVSGYGSGVYILNDQPEPMIVLDQPDPAVTTVPLIGSVDPTPGPGYLNPPGTFYQAEYRLVGSSDWKKFRSPSLVPPGLSRPYKITLTRLLPSSTYEVRVAGVKQFNSSSAFSPVHTVETSPGAPTIHAFSSSDVQADSATLTARIDPRGSETTYRFEYGTTTEYGQSTPELVLGDGQGPESASAPISGLDDAVYHFRVIATNVGGTTVSEDQIFVFHPPLCPNRTIRQQTGANYLPDCRGYELVSPGFIGSLITWPFVGPSSGFATEPSRLSFTGVFGAITGTGDPPNSSGDLYASTRTDSGWVTKYIGLPAHETYSMGGAPGLSVTTQDSPTPRGILASLNMDRFLTWNNGNTNLTPKIGASNAPYLFHADGSFLQRWPTNLDQVPGGEDFKAIKSQLIANAELTHFAFVSDVPFADGGDPGDIYLNDTLAGTVEVINRDENGVAFSGNPIELSADGSSVLMTDAPLTDCEENNDCAPIQEDALYLRKNGTTIDITRGHAAYFAGMTEDASTVYFISQSQVTDDDEDSSVDLFKWQAASNSLTRVSAGEDGAGNTDACVPLDQWTDDCGVVLVSDYERHCFGSGLCDTSRPHFFSGYSKLIAGEGGNGVSDSFLGRTGGDVYFFSPDLLDGPENGVADAANLYVLRDGAPQFVARFDGGTSCSPSGSIGVGAASQVCGESPIARMRVSADGRWAAFITSSQLTDYDNVGRLTMYRYDAQRDVLVCVSCRPNGEPPTGRVLGSTNGLFMTDDGRAFFSTGDPLDPKDTNGAMDVYEYVGGRAQLITSGTGRGFIDPGSDGAQGLTSFSRPGLIGVSADGTDVYFATYDNLVPQDQNGGNLKFYDARVNGGFPFQVPAPGCAAADECHGPGSGSLDSMHDGTGADLGSSGNARVVRRAKCRKPRVKRGGRCVQRKVRKAKHKRGSSRKGR